MYSVPVTVTTKIIDSPKAASGNFLAFWHPPYSGNKTFSAADLADGPLQMPVAGPPGTATLTVVALDSDGNPIAGSDSSSTRTIGNLIEVPDTVSIG